MHTQVGQLALSKISLMGVSFMEWETINEWVSSIAAA